MSALPVRRAVREFTKWEQGLPVAEVAVCPICDAENECGFEDGPTGQLKGWPQEGHCRHFRGFYSAGGGRAYALFGGPS